MRITKHCLIHQPGEHKISLALGARPLHVANQYEKLTLWTSEPKRKTRYVYSFIVCHTGDKVPGDSSHVYVGTVLLHGGSTVYHVFWKEEL